MNSIYKRLKMKMQPGLIYADFIYKVNQQDFRMCTDDELKERLGNRHGKEPLSEAELEVIYAVVKEVIYRLTGFTLFDSQLAASVSLMHGRIAELPTGEGKTLAAVIPAIIYAMQNLHVHVLTFNDYLAERDYTSTRPIYEFCDITVGHIAQGMSKTERIKMYQNQVVYATAKEVGFDYLKNFLCTDKPEFIPFQLQYAIVDEADSLMIDEVRNPLVIACDSPENHGQMKNAYAIVDGLEVNSDFVINKAENQAYLTERGVRRVETAVSIDNLFEEKNIDILSMVNMALQAKFLLRQGVDYIISDSKVGVIDESTGRVIENKRYPDLLHTSVEIKEGLQIGGNTMIYNTITIQNFLLLYNKLSGMTGTAKTSEEELYQVYGLEVDIIPPHIPSQRIDHKPVLCATKSQKHGAIISAISCAHEKGQPVLVGTQSVEESELISHLLSRHGISHCVLNARNNKEESVLIKEAGKPFAITVSTNMAGRGVDIKLGGADEAFKKEAQKGGGLLVIGTGFNRSIRIDNQLRGRAGRQGDFGESCFFISREDEVFDEADGLSINTIKDAAKVQHHIEGVDENARLALSKYAYILEQQRQLITSYRNRILFEREPFNLLVKYDENAYRELVNKAGEKGVAIAEKQLLLHYINGYWAEYLASMESVRDGIHLRLIGGLDPFEEYNKVAIGAYDELKKDIEADVVHGLKTLEITECGIDVAAAGWGNATTAWTYLIDESRTQFSALPRLMKRMHTS